MLSKGVRRALVERLIVAEVVARRGEGPLARRHYVSPRPSRDEAAVEPVLTAPTPEEPR